MQRRRVDKAIKSESFPHSFWILNLCHWKMMFISDNIKQKSMGIKGTPLPHFHIDTRILICKTCCISKTKQVSYIAFAIKLVVTTKFS